MTCVLQIYEYEANGMAWIQTILSYCDEQQSQSLQAEHIDKTVLAYAETETYLARPFACSFAGVHSSRIYQLSMQHAFSPSPEDIAECCAA